MKKITNYCLIFSIILIGFNCKKEEIATPITSIQPMPEVLLKEGVHLNSAEIKALIPVFYKTANKKVVFKSLSGEKIVFKIVYVEEKKKGVLNNVNYTSDTFTAELQSESIPQVFISMTGGSGFPNESTIASGIYILFSPGRSADAMTNNTIKILKDGTVNRDDASGYVESKNYDGKTFKDVYVSRKWDNQKISSEVSFNAEFGIVAFRSLDGETFVYQGIE
jgi:hypothetical protein